ncbi:MAG: glycoside hydrolase family 127 protein [Clostridia bacterium]|nr:glycoside hydrolase family 127 protein [Clostridia bacterium]
MKSMGCQHITLTGDTGKLIKHVTDRFLIGLRESNPAILTMLRDRDIKPYRAMLNWSGEFAGKYLTGAACCYRLNPDEVLLAEIGAFIDELLTYQDEDGYLGCFSKECRLTGAFSQTPDVIGHTWDSWAHYHLMYGLLLWYDITRNESYVKAVEKMAELFMNTFYNGKKTILSTGHPHTNLAVYHIFAILYSRTKDQRYLDFARLVEADTEGEGSLHFLSSADKGLSFWQFPNRRWEGLHVMMGFAEMYRITGEERYLRNASLILESTIITDVHNTGAFSTNEEAIGSPYRQGPIETCCVIAFNALAIELYLLTGKLEYIDFLERSHYNGVMGYFHPSGKWSTYDTPMDGAKCANYHSINFQCRPGSPELNCCSVNAPRGISEIGRWMICEDGEYCYLNTYESCEIFTSAGAKIIVSGDYPACGSVKISCSGMTKPIALRIPTWAADAEVIVNGSSCTATAGEYLKLDFAESAEMILNLHFVPRFEEGGEDLTGKFSLFIGPVLYGMDNADNPTVDFESAVIGKDDVLSCKPQRMKDGSIRLILADGVVLKNFFHLGDEGSFYKTWLNIQ